MVANLRNADEDLARRVAAGLGMATLPPASQPAAAPTIDLPPSPALSILLNGPDTFAGRKVGVLVTDGAPPAALKALQAADRGRGRAVEVIAPPIGGVDLDDGSHLPAEQMIGGGPSVLYDAVAVLASDDGAAELAAMPAAKDFVTDAHAHSKFIGHMPAAEPLFDAAGLGDIIDDGYIELTAEAPRSSSWRPAGPLGCGTAP